MSFTNSTPNYGLPQYVGTDKPTFLGDFNNAMTAIDTALHNNAQNAGEGLSELQQAQAALTETQETLTEVQTEVANVSGIASTVNQNVQQALTAANDATTAANSATSQIQPAVTAANQASADAQAAQQVANGNVSTLTSLSERVTALENSVVTEISTSFSYRANAYQGSGTSTQEFIVNAPENTKITGVEIEFSKFNLGSSASFTLFANDDVLQKWSISAAPVLNTPINKTVDNASIIKISGGAGTNNKFDADGTLKISFTKVS